MERDHQVVISEACPEYGVDASWLLGTAHPATDIDDLERGLRETGWTDIAKDPMRGLDAEERAMAAKLLAPPPKPMPPKVRWCWYSNTLGRQWRIYGRDGLLGSRGFSEAGLERELREYKAEGFQVERGVDVSAAVPA